MVSSICGGRHDVAALICMMLASAIRSRNTMGCALSIALCSVRRTRVTRSAALQLADVALDAAGDQLEHIVGTASRSICAFLHRMAIRVSSSGG